jgi:hypothetical protein
MNCDACVLALADRLSGRLDAPTEAGLARHLEDCAACREEAAGLERVWDLLADPPADVITSSMRARFEQLLRDEARPPVPVAPRRRRLPQLAAALVLLVLGVAAGFMMSTSPSPETGRFLVLVAAPLAGEAGEEAAGAVDPWRSRMRAEGRLEGEWILDDSRTLLLLRAGGPDEAVALARSFPGWHPSAPEPRVVERRGYAP